MWDIFISHASEDKDEVLRPLAIELKRSGLKVWFDETALQIGDSLRESIRTMELHSRAMELSS